MDGWMEGQTSDLMVDVDQIACREANLGPSWLQLPGSRNVERLIPVLECPRERGLLPISEHFRHLERLFEQVDEQVGPGQGALRAEEMWS